MALKYLNWWTPLKALFFNTQYLKSCFDVALINIIAKLILVIPFEFSIYSSVIFQVKKGTAACTYCSHSMQINLFSKCTFEIKGKWLPITY